RTVGFSDKTDDADEGGRVAEKVLAEFVTAAVDGTGTHERSKEWFGAPRPAGTTERRAAGVRGLPEDGAITSGSAIRRQMRRSRIDQLSAIIGAALIVPMPTSRHRQPRTFESALLIS